MIIYIQAHSLFKIPLQINSNSTCNIDIKSKLAEVIRKAVDRTIKDIMSLVDPQLAKKPFGNKVIIFGGDFRQVFF